jgi:hypothetical protein
VGTEGFTARLPSDFWEPRNPAYAYPINPQGLR